MGSTDLISLCDTHTHTHTHDEANN